MASAENRSPIKASRDLLRVLQFSFASEITELVQDRDSLLTACIAAQDTAAEVQQQNRYFNYMIHATPNTECLRNSGHTECMHNNCHTECLWPADVMLCKATHCTYTNCFFLRFLFPSFLGFPP